ncbi:3'-5' exoribonuclease YhaM [Bacillus sp. RG28]|uniref:3'-5' exoribonuclease YhaM n=1 Tax=Gottfriedia endophytica TaxID=2820819 RepID=A0A940SI46_9BACI|nr:3'-5' exoribonuclease YhaM [Gottfriedia endophytica]MBP0726887.1 3'-5' exoribonuclease YhaM [Gottfriedia endophytica]
MSKKVYEYEVGEKFITFFYVKSVTKGVASNQKSFLTITLQDQSGEIDAKIWDVTAEQEEIYKEGAVVKVEGELHDYRGRLQLKLKQIRIVTENDEVNFDDFFARAPLSKEELFESITKYINNMKNEKIRKLTDFLVSKHQKEYLEYPAATKNHHEFVSGLAYHVHCMLRLGESIANLYPSINKDVLYAGIILHDLGKVTELSGPVSTKYTVEGNLLGHISLIAIEIGNAAIELGIEGEEEVTVLQHLVLSHHGKYEYGSPKLPLIKEAEILHYIDNIDAKMNMLDRALERVEPGEFTERVFALENRSFYKPKL